MLREDAAMSILSACGVPAELVTGKAEGTGGREAWRRFLHGSVDPVAKLVAEELTLKLEQDVTLDLSSLHASDVRGLFDRWWAGAWTLPRRQALRGLSGMTRPTEPRDRRSSYKIFVHLLFGRSCLVRFRGARFRL